MRLLVIAARSLTYIYYKTFGDEGGMYYIIYIHIATVKSKSNTLEEL